MITTATVLLGTGTRGDLPRPGFWRVVGQWVYTGLICLGTVMGGAWLGDSFGCTAYGCPRADRPTGVDPGPPEHDNTEVR